MSSEKNYECKICDKNFKIYASYYSHKRNLHLKPRLKCVKCNENFSTHNLLYKHAYINNCTRTTLEKAVVTPIFVSKLEKLESINEFFPYQSNTTSSLLSSFAFDN